MTRGDMVSQNRNLLLKSSSWKYLDFIGIKFMYFQCSFFQSHVTFLSVLLVDLFPKAQVKLLYCQINLYNWLIDFVWFLEDFQSWF